MATRKRRVAAAAYSSPSCYLHEFEDGSPADIAHGVDIKRIYAARCAADGYRVLVDRLWPRGLSRARAALDAWLPQIAPSAKLRQWFHHDETRWVEFSRRYRTELRAQAEILQQLRTRATREHVTLLYSARNERINHAMVLRAVLRRPPRTRGGGINPA